MKKIDPEQVKLEANRSGISPCLLMKRKIGYKKSKGNNCLCLNCTNHRTFFEHIQCSMIGESKDDPYAIIEPFYTCKYFE